MERWRTEALIALLDDPSAREDERDDAVVALGDSDDARARAVLLRLAGDPETAYVVAASAGESLGGIAARTGALDAAEVALLRADARTEYRAAYRRFAPPPAYGAAAPHPHGAGPPPAYRAGPPSAYGAAPSRPPGSGP